MERFVNRSVSTSYVQLQRSHAPKCVERTVTVWAFELLSVLQRSHAPKCVERTVFSTGKRPLRCFNGATHRSAWRAALCCLSPTPRQIASTEPRTEVRGEAADSAPENPSAQSFNGATHRSAWRGHLAPEPWREVERLQRSHAPKCVERSYWNLARLHAGRLQRSHAPKCVERMQLRSGRWTMADALQRSHAPKCVESRVSKYNFPITFRCFNGATHRSAWRVCCLIV